MEGLRRPRSPALAAFDRARAVSILWRGAGLARSAPSTAFTEP